MNSDSAITQRRRVLGAIAMTTLATSISHAFAATACGPTARTTAGPFYVRNAPTLENINRRGLPGTPMHISGTVFGGRDGREPLAGAIVELWHCDDDGHYHPNGSGDVSQYPAAAVNLRGIGVTDEAGHYRFDSIVPGHYGNRRRHIHWHVVAPGHRPLTTQSYWHDEKGTLRERRDGVDRNTDDCRWVKFETVADGVASGIFDLVLEPLG